jgi:hypothetical protein
VVTGRADRRKTEWATLRMAAGVAAAVGLVAGEVLNELRRHRVLGRRSWRRA